MEARSKMQIFGAYKELVEITPETRRIKCSAFQNNMVQLRFSRMCYVERNDKKIRPKKCLFQNAVSTERSKKEYNWMV